MMKVLEKEDDLKNCHFDYCNTANVQLDSAEAREFLRDKIDQSADCVDKCMLLIDEDAVTAQDTETKVKEETEAKEVKEQVDKQYKAAYVQCDADDKFALELCSKIKLITDDDVNTAEKVALVTSYRERLDWTPDSLTTSWGNLFALSTAGEDLKITEMNAMRLQIQDALSAATVYGEMFKQQEEEKKLSANPTKSDDSPKSDVSSKKEESHSGLSLRTEKIKLPTFSGDVRLFAKFQRDYEKIVVPAHPDVTQRAYVLKDSCLKDAAKKYVENIDDLEEIWKRLKKKYGDKLILVEIVITELEGSPTMKASDDQKFVSFVDILEKGLQDLEAVGARSKVANMYSIKLLEKKISRTHYLAWLKEEPNLEGTARFEKLFSFLKGERKGVEKVIQRSGSTPDPAKKDPKDLKNPRGSFGATNNDSSKTKATRNNCLVYSNVFHFTRRCRAFLAKTAEQRAAVVKAVNGCELCLTVTHVGKPCPFLQNWETCKLDGCDKYHSRLLHEADVQGFLGHLAGAVVNTSARSLKKNTILLVQRISTNVGMVCAFFDNGSTLTLISTSFVTRHRLKGIKISYNLHTVGGITTHQTTYLHDITLVDTTGKTHIVQALEIEEISGVMKKVDVSGVVTLFQNLQLDDVLRVHGQVELLIRSDHLGVHPKELGEVEGLRLSSVPGVRCAEVIHVLNKAIK